MSFCFAYHLIVVYNVPLKIGTIILESVSAYKTLLQEKGKIKAVSIFACQKRAADCSCSSEINLMIFEFQQFLCHNGSELCLEFG